MKTRSPVLAALPLALAALAAAACEPPPPVAPRSAVEPPPSASAAPAPAPLAKRSSGLRVVLDLAKTPIPVSIGEAAIDLAPMAGRTFVTIQDVLFYVDGDTLRSDPALQRGISDMPRQHYMTNDLGAMGGHWPDAAWVETYHRGERIFQSSFLRWTPEEGWVPFVAGDSGVSLALVPLPNGWTVSMEQTAWYYVAERNPPRSLVMMHPRWGVRVRNLDPADSIATLPDGTLFTAVDGRVSRFAPDGSPVPMPQPPRATTSKLPVTSTVVAVAPDLVYLLDVRNDELGKSLNLEEEGVPPPPERALHRFDGARWLPEPTPFTRPDRIVAGPRGALWVMHEGDLYERARDGTWSSLEVPAPLDKVWVAGDDDVWATSGGKLLLHTRPLPAGLDLAAIVPPAPEGIRWSPDSCPSMTALLDELPRTAPADLDLRKPTDAYDATLGKLSRRFAFYDLPLSGKRRLAAYLSAEQELGGVDTLKASAALVALAKKRGVPGPRLVCLNLPDDVEGARLARAAAPPPPPPPPPPEKPPSMVGCATPMVILFAPAKSAPKDFDFPLTRKALRGHTEFAKVRFYDTQRGGKRVIVATAPDLKTATGLEGLIRRSVAGSAPALVCEQPGAGAREVRVDMATGEVKK